MSGLQRIVRHPDRLNDLHVRAAELTSEALLGPINAADAAWLEAHLAGCDACRAVADAFASDAAVLHGLRDDQPPVPRDLGARVSLALDDEVRRATRGRARRVTRARRDRGSARRPSLVFAGLAAVAVVALLVGPLAVPLALPAGTTPPAGSERPLATPIDVDTQPVAWVSKAADGSYVISSASVGEVCPGANASACGTLDGSARTVGSLQVKPSSVTLSRDGSPAVVVGNDAVYAVAVDLAPPVTTPAPGTSPVPTTQPVQTPAVTGEPASPPADSPSPPVSTPSPSPTPSPTPSPPVSSATPELTPEPSPVEPTTSPALTPGPSPEATATPEPTVEPTPIVATPLPTMPPPTPAPTAATAVKIAEAVVLVGASPAYSPDGEWVAFSARPSDGAHGPDLYAWHIGDKTARALTDDHGWVFSGWLDGRILASAARLVETPTAAPPGSEVPTDVAPTDASPTPAVLPTSVIPPADADPAQVVARSFLFDPARRAATEIISDGVWRPVVDSTERVVVYWTGSLAWSPVDRAWMPASGHLVSAEWKSLLDGAAGAAQHVLPRAAADASATDWEVRFDPAGRRLAVWVADQADPGTGRLALGDVADDGTLGAVVLADVGALPGFSLGADRLAWSTPPGRNGEGSRVTVFAWRGDAAGQLLSVPDPGNEPVVVAH